MYIYIYTNEVIVTDLETRDRLTLCVVILYHAQDLRKNNLLQRIAFKNMSPCLFERIFKSYN